MDISFQEDIIVILLLSVSFMIESEPEGGVPALFFLGSQIQSLPGALKKVT